MEFSRKNLVFYECIFSYEEEGGLERISVEKNKNIGDVFSLFLRQLTPFGILGKGLEDSFVIV